MSDQADSATSTPSSSNQPVLNVPSIEDVHKRGAPQGLPSFFNSKRARTDDDSTATISASPPTTSISSRATSESLTTSANANNSSNKSSTLHNRNTYSPSPTPSVSSIGDASTITPAFSPSKTPTVRRIVSSSGNSILVSPTQRKNPVLRHIVNVPYEFSDAIKVDYVVGQTTGVLYLSLRYHRLYPTYLDTRFEKARQLYVARILLVLVDTEDYHDTLREINRLAVFNNWTLILSWSLEEAGRYLETYKAFEHKAPDWIREKVEEEYMPKITGCLTQVKSVNKTDVLTLLSTFRSLKGIAMAKPEQLAMCPGFGEQKVKRLQQIWKQPFLENKKTTK